MEEDIKLIVNYKKKIEKLIAEGNYDWKDDCITAENFSTPSEVTGKKVSVSVKLFHFNRNISSADAISEIDNAGYRPATLIELLTLGILLPELQRQFPIAAIGSIWQISSYVCCAPVLHIDDSGRRLGVAYFVNGWYSFYRFLGVRK